MPELLSHWSSHRSLCGLRRPDQDSNLEEEVGNEEAQQAEQSNNLHRNTASAAGFCRKSALCGALLSASRNIPLSQARSRLFL